MRVCGSGDVRPRRLPCRSGKAVYWRAAPPLGHATTFAAARWRRAHRGPRRGTSSCRYRCRSRRSRYWVSETWRAPCLWRPLPASLAGGAGARPDHPISGVQDRILQYFSFLVRSGRDCEARGLNECRLKLLVRTKVFAFELIELLLKIQDAIVDRLHEVVTTLLSGIADRERNEFVQRSTHNRQCAHSRFNAAVEKVFGTISDRRFEVSRLFGFHRFDPHRYLGSLRAGMVPIRCISKIST